MIALLINAIVLAVFAYYAFKKKESLIVCILLGIYSFSSLAGILYLTEFLFETKINVLPILYLNVCLAVVLIPVLFFDGSKIYISEKSVDVIEKVLIFVGIVSIIPFIEQIIYFIQTYISGIDSSVNDIYTEKMQLGHEEIRKWLSPISLRITQSLGRFSPITLFCVFVVFTARESIPWRRIIIYAIAVLTPLLDNLNCSGRISFAFFCMSIVFLYLIFAKNIIVQLPRLFYIFCTAIISIGILVITTITLLRHESTSGTFTTTVWTSLYFGEGIVNFSNEMWFIKCSTLGDNCFSFFKTTLGFDSFTDNLERREYWNETVTGVDPVRFYTFIGDWFSDFGLYFTPVFVVIIALSIYKITQKETYTIIDAFIFYIYCYIIGTGFTFYCYKSYYTTLNIMFCVVLVSIIHFFNKDYEDIY